MVTAIFIVISLIPFILPTRKQEIDAEKVT